jgi:pyruvate dehydrogenase E1 component alpha subunit
MPFKDVGKYRVQHLQILNEKGHVDPKLEPKLAKKDLLALYRAMLLARAADDRQLKLQRQGRMGTFGPCTGQEAAVCGPTYAMTSKDWFVGAFREIGGRLMRGVKLSEEYLFWNGWEEGNVTREATRTLPNAVVVG